MTLEEKLDNIAKTSTVERLKADTAKDFDELWKKVIEPNLPDKDSVIGWHNLLMQYIQQDNAVFTLRCYPDRRGFLNKVFVHNKESFETFYTDNSVPFYFYSMAKDGFVPNIAEFNDAMINNRMFPCSYFPSKGVYPQGKNHGINSKGYKLAHIFSTGENYDKKAGYTSITNFCEAEFPNANITKWNSVLPNGKYYRRIDIDDHPKAETVRAFAVAHFLRSVYPLNYFLVPMTTGIEDKESKIKKTNIYWYDNEGREREEIGENSELIEYVASKIKSMYENEFGKSGKSVYQEFLDLIFPIGNCLDPGGANVEINAEYAIDIWERKKGGLTSPTTTTKSVSTTRAISKSNNKYSFDGEGRYPQSQVLLKLVSKYIETHLEDDISKLKEIFDLKLVYNKKPIILTHPETTQYMRDKGKVVPMTLAEGSTIYINKQVQIGDMEAIIHIANRLNYTIEKI